MTMTSRISQTKLKELLSYNPKTGEFYWRVERNGIKRGKIAGYLHKTGYRRIKIEGQCYKVSKWAWLYMTGKWSITEIDHKNGIRDDDRWKNLRAASHAENCYNRKKRSDNSSGVKGVSWYPRYRKWLARIQVDRRNICLGYFEEFNNAVLAYERGSKKHHGKFARTK